MPLSSFVEIESYIKNHARFTLFQLTPMQRSLATYSSFQLVGIGKFSFSLAIPRVSHLLRWDSIKFSTQLDVPLA